MTIKQNIEKHCLGLNCPERKSICCGAGCEAVSGDEGTGHYQCKKCHGEFIGGKCTAGDIIPPDAERTGDKGLLKSLKEDAMMDEAIASASLSESDTPPIDGTTKGL